MDGTGCLAFVCVDEPVLFIDALGVLGKDVVKVAMLLGFWGKYVVRVAGWGRFSVLSTKSVHKFGYLVVVFVLF